ncbi:ABC transporter permease [Aminipila butyrica]|nr:ABC transporter permease [Aminipila butyrica]
MKNNKRVMTLPGMAVLFFCAIVPLFIMLAYSFQSDSGTGFTLENYSRFFTKTFYLTLTLRTIVNSLLVTVISLLLSYPLAYIMAKHLKGLKNIVMVLLIIPFFTNQLVRVYSWLIFLQDGGVFERLMNTLGLVDGTMGLLYTRAAVIIGLIHAFFPYMVITIYMALERLDNSLLEASSCLGASKTTTFFRVVLPMSMPGVITGIMIVFVPCLGTFVEPRILGGVNGTVIGTVIEDQFFEIYGWNFGAAIAFILLAMVLVSMAAINRLGRRYEG